MNEGIVLAYTRGPCNNGSRIYLVTTVAVQQNMTLPLSLLGADE
jgi:hypothetical protein